MKFLTKTLAVLVCIAALFGTSAQADLVFNKKRDPEVANWLGKYPHEKIDEVSLVEHTDIANFMRYQFGNERYGKFKTHTVSTPVAMSGKYIVIKNCMPHGCNLSNSAIFIDTRTKQMSACIADTNPDGTEQKLVWGGQEWSGYIELTQRPTGDNNGCFGDNIEMIGKLVATQKLLAGSKKKN